MVIGWALSESISWIRKATQGQVCPVPDQCQGVPVLCNPTGDLGLSPSWPLPGFQTYTGDNRASHIHICSLRDISVCQGCGNRVRPCSGYIMQESAQPTWKVISPAQRWAVGKRTSSGQVSVTSLGGLTPAGSKAYGFEVQQFLGSLAQQPLKCAKTD